MTTEVAKRLLKAGLALLGTDRLSVDDSGGNSFAVHRELLGTGCVILEGLQLAGVEPGRYTLFAAPLAFVGAEASPVRAFLKPRK